VTAARNLRADLGLDPKLQLSGLISGNADILAVAAAQAVAIGKLAGLSLQAGVTPTTGAVRSTAEFSLSIDVPAGQMEAHRKRLEKERDQLTKNIASIKRQLGDDVFLGKAPAPVVDSIRTKLADYEVQLAKVLQSLEG